ncbi:MAG TPA: hypothetical protein VIM53_04040 [Candidatus Saccharimonadales bacterium]
MAQTAQEHPKCTYRILQEHAAGGAEPEDKREADMIADIDERPHQIACNVGDCMLAGFDMQAVMKPNGETTERLAVIADAALPECGFGEAAVQTVADRIAFGDMTEKF